DIGSIRKYEDLPYKTKMYIEFIENQIGYPIKFISNGPKRENIIFR
ncbi:MAG TPA: adenylosuccinate synthetase, partial [Ruminiclostridium sp.]